MSKLPRTRELTELLVGDWAVSDLWDKFGIVSDIVVRINGACFYFMSNSFLIQSHLQMTLSVLTFTNYSHLIYSTSLSKERLKTI